MKRVFAHIGFSFAITLIVLNFFKINTALVILAVIGAAFVVSLMIKRTRKSVSVPLCLFSSILACVIFISNYYGAFIPQTNLDNETAETEFYIVDLEEKTPYGYNYTVKTRYIHAENVPQNIKLDLKSRSRMDADYYQIIKGKMKFSLISDNGYTSYGTFGSGIYLSADADEFRKTEETVFSLNKYILDLREDIINLILKNVDGDSSGLIIALTTGNKSYLNDEIKDNFKASGTMHIMAVSGLHLAVFSGSVYFILKKLRIPKVPLILISVLSIIFYAAIAGFSKSIIRAGIMMIILMLGRLFKEKSDALNSLGLAVLIICLNPYAVTDAGALLTVTAVLGLITLHPHIKRIFSPKNPVIKYFYDILTASVAVFITTLPVMYFVFGYITPYGILLNLIMIPLAQLTLISSFLMLFSFGITPVVSVASSLPAFLSELMIDITAYVAKLPFAVVGIEGFEFGFALGIVFILFGAAFLIHKKHIYKNCAVISTAVFLIIISVSYLINFNSVYIREIPGYYSTAVVVYNRKNAVVIGVKDSLQLAAVSNIIKSKNLEISLIIDNDKNNYSERLAEKFQPVNYVADKENINGAVNCSNIYTENDFNVDLWQELNVEYSGSGRNSYVCFRAYNTEFVYSENKENRSVAAVYLNNDNMDKVYTVNRNGCSERRLNEWLK